MIDKSKLTKIERIIFENARQEDVQADADLESSIMAFIDEINSGKVLAVEDQGLVCTFKPVNKWVAKFDIFSENHTFQMIRSGQRITKFLFEETPFTFAYGFSPNKKMIRSIERGGWKYMGVMPQSYWDGEKFIDQYMYGVSKKEFFEFLENENKK